MDFDKLVDLTNKIDPSYEWLGNYEGLNKKLYLLHRKCDRVSEMEPGWFLYNH